MSILRVISDQLSPGAIPTYSIPKDWPYPIYSIAKDGKTIICLDPGTRERVFLDTFELSSMTRLKKIWPWSNKSHEKDEKGDLKEQIAEILTGLVLTAGFAGEARLAIRSDHIIGTTEGAVSVINIAIMFTVDFDEEEPVPGEIILPCLYWMPKSLPEIVAKSSDLIDGLAVSRVMAS